MKLLTLRTVGILLLLSLYSCKKESGADKNYTDTNENLAKRPDNPGFASNDMVLYWNEKTATVLGAPMNQPRRARLFAITQIAVHDALNAIKPKFERFAFINTRQAFANPDAAVASAAYWAIKGLNLQGSFPVDSWYNASLATIPDGDSKELGKTLGNNLQRPSSQTVPTTG